MGLFSRKKKAQEPDPEKLAEAMTGLLRTIKKERGQVFLGTGECPKCGTPAGFVTAKQEPRTIPCPKCHTQVTIDRFDEYEE
jgi:hypothetical protein